MGWITLFFVFVAWAFFMLWRQEIADGKNLALFRDGPPIGSIISWNGSYWYVLRHIEQGELELLSVRLGKNPADELFEGRLTFAVHKDDVEHHPGMTPAPGWRPPPKVGSTAGPQFSQPIKGIASEGDDSVNAKDER